MVAHDSGYSVPRSPSKDRANYAGVNLPAHKRGEGPTNADESFRGSPGRRMEASEYMSLVHGCALLYPKECEFLDSVIAHYIEGSTIAAIAAKMGVPRTTAKQRITRTLNFLEQFIREQEQET